MPFDGIAPRAHGGPNGAPEVRAPGPLACRRQTQRTPRGTGDAQLRHPPARFDELVGGVVGEVAVAQHLGDAVAQLYRLAIRGALARGVAIVVVGVEGQGDRLARLRLVGAAERRLEVGGECPVIGVDVLGAPDQRRPPGPIHVVASPETDGTERFGE